MNLTEKKRKILIGFLIGVGAALMIVTASLSGYAYWLTSQPEIHSSVYIEGVNISGQTREEALQNLQEKMESKLEEKELVLEYDDKRWVFPYQSIGYNYDYDSAVDQAISLGRQGNMLQNALKIYRMRDQVHHIELEERFDMGLVEEILDKLQVELARKGVPATITRESREFIITPDTEGRDLKREETKSSILEALEGEHGESVAVITEKLTVYPTEADLKAIDGVIGEFSTRFNAGTTGRSSNLKLGAYSIRGTLLLPGEKFSFNETTGPRVASAGYQEAPVILRGELVPGIGGGICQVSTTLYNAVVRANLNVVERRNHSLPVSYVDLGHDATVAYGAIDLKFENNYEYPVFIESFINGNQLHVQIFGNSNEVKQTVTMASQVTQVIEPETEEKEDPELYEGETVVEQEPKKGYRVVTYKIYYENGQEVNREELSRDHYQPVKGIILVGTKPRSIFDEFLEQALPENYHEEHLTEEVLDELQE